MIPLIVFHLAVLVLAVLGHPWLAFFSLFAGHMILLIGTLVPGVSLFGPVRTRLPPDGQSVWLTFDDGPDPTTTLPTLELLRSHHAQATFFLIGERANRHPELVDAILAGGHEIANHTDTHPAKQFWRLLPRALRREIQACQVTLARLTGRRPRRFRAPAGMHNPFLFPILESEDLSLEGWSHRGFDGTHSNPERITARLERDLTAGSIILLHEGRPTTVRCTEHLLATLADRDLRCRIPID
ncbi:polysaccharide deacetylase family protein [soil metagenome]